MRSSSRITGQKMNTCDSNSDIISHVPVDRIENNLMCLPIQDAVKTSLLSRKWRYVWSKLPHLVFDDEMLYKEMHRPTHAKLLMIIYQVLSLHRGPIIKFTLFLAELESCSEIDQLILLVSSNDIQDFKLGIWQGVYKLPSSLYSCLQLRHLRLHSCMLKPPPGFEGFPRLISLDFEDVVIADDVLSSLISNCPLLEDLRLHSSTSSHSLEVVGLYSCLQLRHLRLHSCMLKPPPGFEGFPRLISLDFDDVVIADDVLSSLISNCPLLEMLFLYSSTSSHSLEVAGLFSCLQLRHLRLHSCMLKPPPGFEGFPRLISLDFDDVVIADDVLSSLISNCPLLEKLFLYSSTSSHSLEVFGLYSCLQLRHLRLHSCMLKPPPGFEGFPRLISLDFKDVVIADDILSSLISNCPLLEKLFLYSSTSSHSLEVVGPNLKCVRCDGHFRSICFTNTSRLANVIIYLVGARKELFCSKDEISSSVMLLESVPVIESLRLDFCYVKGIAASGLPTRFPTILNNLKKIWLYDICFGEQDEVSILICLIRSSPNLEEVNIRAFPDETYPIPEELDLSGVHGFSDVSPNQLRRVVMENISGAETELEFIKLLLAKSPMLETMLIEVDDSRSLVSRFRIVQELTRFRRALPRAEMNVF